ncbi:ABC transporter [Paenibacillus sp. FSL H8-0548]|uniref:ABC transporter ATP-binding protein n=1 Tax=Paenibacillus sp. FSL H8-0548 TaxID=1920422 RepID=UPI00096C0A52|nr:ABC transporter ATP-binding protein [Paenibacillus sp. FSL H8-0548]OMF37705.1 ABC transporter [Paenibacillus sp. FSL H8-0548]
MSYVEAEHIRFRYAKKQKPVIDNFSFVMEKGEIVGIIGASGSGKSTLLRIIAGLEEPERGNLSINDRVIMNERVFVETEKRGVGMVFQDYALFPHLTVEANIAFGLKRQGRAERLKEMLELIQLDDYAKRYPHELSGGQQQRVALARALAPSPAILLMDEPFSNLDAELKLSIRGELREILQKSNTTCLLVSHDQADIEAICSRFIRMGADQ